MYASRSPIMSCGPARVKEWVSVCVTVTDNELRSRPRKGLGLPATNAHPDR